MKTIKLVLCMLSFGLVTGNAQALILDFDDIVASETNIIALDGNRYSADGVVISSDGGLFAFTAAAAYTNTGSNYIYGSSVASSGAAANSDVIFDFTTATDYVSFYLADVQTGTGSQWDAYAYDTAGLEIAHILGTTNDEIQISFMDLGLIGSVVFSASTDLEGVDTLEFDYLNTPPVDRDPPPASVPEPMTLMLMSFGLIGLGFARRKQNAA